MEHSTASLFISVWRSKLYILLIACFVFSLALSILLPALPSLATNFFASQHAGYQLDCEDYDVAEQPWACQAAHADVVRWASLNSLLANTFLAFFFAPLVGDLSDRVGRKPFMLAGITLAVLPITAIWLHVTQHTSFLWYYPLNALTAVVAPIISFLSYTADVLPAEIRTPGFGLITASFSIGFTIGPSIGNALGAAHGALAAAAALAASFLLVAVAVPESYPAKPAGPRKGPPGMVSAPSGTAAASAVLSPSPAAVATAASRRRPLDVFRSMGRSWALINSSSLFRRLALCMAVVGVVSEGIQDMLLQYLQLVIGFNTADQTVLITVIGGTNFVVQALLLPYLTKLFGERHLLVFGLLFSITEQTLLALSVNKWQAISAVSLSAFAGVSFPAISSLKSTHARADQQGLVQGALAGIRAVASGLGPLGLAQLFAMSTTAEAFFGYKPSMVFWTTCALTIVAAAVAASIPEEAVKLPIEPPTAAVEADSDDAGYAGSSASSTSGRDSPYRAWLLGDVEDGCCKVKTVTWDDSCKQQGCAGSPAGDVDCYQPPSRAAAVSPDCVAHQGSDQTAAAGHESPAVLVVVQDTLPEAPADQQQQADCQ